MRLQYAETVECRKVLQVEFDDAAKRTPQEFEYFLFQNLGEPDGYVLQRYEVIGFWQDGTLELQVDYAREEERS